MIAAASPTGDFTEIIDVLVVIAGSAAIAGAVLGGAGFALGRGARRAGGSGRRVLATALVSLGVVLLATAAGTGILALLLR